MKTSFEKFMASSAVTEVTKVEMGEVKVELAAIALTDIQNKLDESYKLREDYNTSIDKMQSIATQGIKAMGTLYKNLIVIDKQVNDLEKQLKEMGIQPTSLQAVNDIIKQKNTLLPTLTLVQKGLDSVENIKKIQKV
jgi:uncharacterized coiled-coil DUF342 family protein